MRRLGTVMALCLALIGSGVWAQDVVGSVVSQLRQQGFDRISITRTFLGRTRVRATSPRHQREIVINPISGEILRDVWQQRGGAQNPGTAQLVDPRDTDDPDVDDDRDDDRDDGRGRGRGRGRGGDEADNSGSGSGNSGHGSGGDDGDDGGDDGDDGDDGGDNSGSGSGGDDGDDGGGNSGSGGGDDD